MNIECILNEATRELKMREKLYPRWLAAGKMTQEAHDRQLKLQRGIVEYLQLSHSMLSTTDREEKIRKFKKIEKWKSPAPVVPRPRQEDLFPSQQGGSYGED